MKIKKFLKYNLYVFSIGFVIGLVLLAYTYFVEPYQLVVKEVSLNVPHWSPELNGFKIVAISDIHAGSNFITEEKIREIVAQANAQRPAGFTHVGIHVENMPQAVQLFQARGLTVTEPRLSVPVGSTQASITDPNGLRVELTELPPASLQRKAMDAWR